MKSLLTIALLSLPLVASAGLHSSFKVKGKVSYCGQGHIDVKGPVQDSKGGPVQQGGPVVVTGPALEEAFVAAKHMAEDTAAAVCRERGLYAARVTEWRTEDDKSDCTAKAKARFICAIEPVTAPIEVKGEVGKQGETLPAPVPSQGPTPELPQGPAPELPPEAGPVPQLPN